MRSPFLGLPFVLLISGLCAPVRLLLREAAEREADAAAAFGANTASDPVYLFLAW
eukprot:m.311539 g.311539  ORF g.311539 m.311539 type:complete len:55 (-) comp55363_c1_seq13:77-241(-)